MPLFYYLENQAVLSQQVFRTLRCSASWILF